MEPSEALASALTALNEVATAQLAWMSEATELIDKLQRDVRDLERLVHDRTDHLA